MNRFALAAVALVALAIAAVVFFAEPEVEPPPPVQPPTVRTVAPDAAAAPAPPRPRPPVPETPLAAADAGPAPDAAVEQGPYRVDLGEHSVLLAERDGRFLRVGLQLVTPTLEGRAELIRRRRELIRMLYFLASKRSAEAIELPDAEARFEADLAPRYQNAVRSGAIADIEFTRFQMERRAIPTPDAGPDTP